MNNLIIKDSIRGVELIIENGIIKYGSKTFSLDKIIDFDFFYGSFNGSGGCTITLKDSNDKMYIGTNFGGPREQKKIQTEINKIQNLFQKLIPILLMQFVQFNYQKIQNGAQVKVWKLRFDKQSIAMRPRTQFWLNKIVIPYNQASTSSPRQSIGLFGSGGNCNGFYLHNKLTGTKYRYSSSPNFTPQASDIIKIEALLNKMKSINS